MFTGIITHVGTCKEQTQKGFIFEAPETVVKTVKEGSSIAVNGVCLTITGVLDKTTFSVDVMPETFEKTVFRRMKKNDLVNLELPMGISDRFEGHMVLGHVDGVGAIQSLTIQENSHIIRISVLPTLAMYMVEKGSIAVNGISLTLISVGDDYFTIGSIPYTYNHTMLKQAKVGDLVNIEVDILAKYFLKFFTKAFNKANYEKH